MGIPKIKEKITDLDKEFLRPNTQVTDIKNVHADVITSIQKEAIDNFIADFKISNLFQQSEEGGLMKFLPVVGAIISIITLIVVIAK